MKLFVLMTAAAAGGMAQGPTDVPPILQVIRKPGNNLRGTIRPYQAARAAVDVVGLTAITGLPENWGIELHQTFAEIEDLDRAVASQGPGVAAEVPPTQDDLLAPARTMILLYQPGWSYRPQEAVRRIPRARYFHISVYRMRPGAENDMAELMRLRRHEMDSVNLDRPDLVYRVISGAPSATYIILAPMLSLRVMDDGVAKLPIFAEPLAAAEATAAKTAASQELSREHFIFRVEPSQSYVSDDFAGADSEFWHGKPAPAQVGPRPRE